MADILESYPELECAEVKGNNPERGPELICSRCREYVTDVDDGDRLDVLVRVFMDHMNTCAGDNEGEG